MAEKPDNQKDFLELLVDYGKSRRTPPSPAPTPTPNPTPVPTPEPYPDWRALLPDDERYVLSLANAGSLGAIERLILHMKEMLDERSHG